MERIYYEFNYPDAAPKSITVLTGIQRVKKKFYITGIYKAPPKEDITFIYKGDLKGNGVWHVLKYKSLETNLFGPVYLKNHIHVAGTIKTNGRIGVVYNGLLNGVGDWIKIRPPYKDIIDIVVHSTFGDIVIGNYRTKAEKWYGFICDIKTNQYYTITHPNTTDVLGYGVVYNHGYILCGSYTIPNTDIEVSYLLDWDNQSKKFSNWRSYMYNNDPMVSTTRFNGMSVIDDQYYITGFHIKDDKKLGFIARVKNNAIQWENIDYPGSTITAGNSIHGDIIVGIYNETHGFISILK